MTKFSRFVFILALACAANPAQAISTFTSQASFLAALGANPVTTFDFESLTPGDLINDGDTLVDPINGLDATFNYSLPYPIIVDNYFMTTSGSNYLGTDDGSFAFFGGDSFTVSFASDLRAAGLYVIGAPGVNIADDFTLSVNNSAGDSVGNSDNPDQTFGTIEVPEGDAFFIGLIADNPGEAFSSLTLSSLFLPGFEFQFNVDDISVSPASVSAVPLPAAAWLFGSALLGMLGFGGRRRQPS